MRSLVERRRHRRWVLGGVVVVGLLALATTAGSAVPVGHFASPAAADRYDATYRAAMATMPVPDTTLDLRTDYGVVRAYRFDAATPGAAADPRPLVLLPGRASASPQWADNLPSLRAIRTVWTLDLLGEPGRSIPSRPIPDDEAQAAWLDQALAALPAPAVHLLGHSLGARTAADVAARRPAHVASVVLLDPVQTASIPLGTVLRSLPASVRWLPRSWRDAFTSWTAGGAPVDREPVAEMIEAGMQTYRSAAPAPSLLAEDLLRRIPVPVLAVFAGRSVMLDAADAAATARRVLPAATVVTYPDATHAMTGEMPERIAADVAAFLATSPPTGPRTTR